MAEKLTTSEKNELDRGPGHWHGPGWHRIGRHDSVRRRSTWARVGYNGDPETGAEPVLIEMIAGREGDDAKVTVRPDNPVFADLALLLEYAIANLPEVSDE